MKTDFSKTVLTHDPQKDEVCRLDNAPVKRVELRCGTKLGGYSVVSAEELINRAAEWTHKAIAITDCGAVHSFPEAFETARNKSIKIIYGVQVNIFIENTQNESCRAALLVQNKAGLRNLYKIISLYHTQSPHPENVPVVSKTVLAQHREGLLIGAAWELNANADFGELFRDISMEQLTERAGFYDYFEIMPLSFIKDQIDKTAFDFEVLY